MFEKIFITHGVYETKKMKKFLMVLSSVPILFLVACGYEMGISIGNDIPNSEFLEPDVNYDNTVNDEIDDLNAGENDNIIDIQTEQQIIGTWMRAGAYLYDEATSEWVLEVSMAGVYSRFSLDGTYTMFSLGNVMHHFDRDSVMEVDGEYVAFIGEWSISEGKLSVFTHHVWDYNINHLSVSTYQFEGDSLFLINPETPYVRSRLVRVD